MFPDESRKFSLVELCLKFGYVRFCIIVEKFRLLEDPHRARGMNSSSLLRSFQRAAVQCAPPKIKQHGELSPKRKKSQKVSLTEDTRHKTQYYYEASSFIPCSFSLPSVSRWNDVVYIYAGA